MKHKKTALAGHNYYWELYLNSEGKVSYLSPSWHNITGFRPEDLINDPLKVARFIHPEDLPRFEAYVRETYEQQLPGETEVRIVRPDGEIRWINHVFVPIFDEHGQYTGTRTSGWDVTERKKAEEIIKTQLDLGLALDNISSLREALQLCLETAIKVSGLDAGGIYILDETTGDLNLIATLGLSDRFALIAGKSPADSVRTKMVLTGNPVYLTWKMIQAMRTEDLTGEKICSVAVLPFSDKGRIIGCLNIASRTHRDIPDQSRQALEAITQQIGAAVARSHAEQNLRISEEKYRAVVENAIEGIFQTTPEGLILSANPAMASLLGYSSPADLMRNVTNVIQLYAHPADRMTLLREIAEKGYVNKYEVQLVRKDGLKILIAINATPIKDKKGNIISYDLFYEDITDREQAKEKLKESETRLSNIIDFLPDATFVIDLEGKVIAWNRAMEQMSGVRKEDMIGQGDHAYSIPFYSERRPHLMDLMATGDKDIEAKYQYVQRGKNSLYAQGFAPALYGGKGAHIASTAALLFDNCGNCVGIIESIRDITNLKRAEEELQEAHKRLDEIIKFLPDATFVIDLEGKVIAWNRAMEQLTKIKEVDMLGKGNYEYSLPLYGERRPMLIDLVLKPQEEIAAKYVSTEVRDTVLEGEAYMPALRRGEVYLFGSARTLKDSKGNIIGAIESIRDISERRRTEEKLTKSEEKFRKAFYTSPDPINITRLEDGMYISINPGFTRVMGYAEEDIIGKTSIEYNIWNNIEDRHRLVAGLKKDGTVNNLEAAFRKKGGEILYMLTSASIIDLDGVPHLLSISRDITDRRRADEKYRGIFETAVMGIFQATPEGRIISANPAFARLLGYESPEEVVNTVIDIARQVYIDPQRRAEFMQLLNAQNTLQEQEVQLLKKDGSTVLIAYLSSRAVRDDTGKVLYYESTIQDITDRRRLESQLRQAQKMEAIGTLAGGIAHDFNNILASIMGYTEMSGKEVRQYVRQNYLDQVLQACERAKNLVNQIMTFSRSREKELKPLDIKLILKEALGLLRATLPTTIEIKQDITREETAVLADPTQIHQIIMNLSTNAAHAMREQGGLLDICLSNIEILHPALSPHRDLPVGSYVQLSFRDTGHGIDAAIKDKIFDPFFTTKNSQEGTGLGLSVVYGIVKNHGGAIDVQSLVGQGTTFTIYLPRIRSENKIEGKVQEDIDLQGHERILFVDDEETLVKMTKIFFQSLGYSITATASSSEALLLFQEDPGAFDLVITDMTMPQMTGAELSRAILKIRPELPVILCTGYSDSINTAQVRKLNIREFILKPIPLHDLGLLVRRILESSDKKSVT